MAFHVQLRQLPHVARVFNLTGEELTTRLLEPWVAGSSVRLQDRHWDPARARLTIYEGRQLRLDEIGVGRGWANVTRTGAEVTAELVERARGDLHGRAPTDRLKAAIQSRCGAGPLALRDVVALAGTEQARASERLALAEQAVWELLHAGTVQLVHSGRASAPDGWRAVLLSWTAWRDPAVALALPGQATTSAISRVRSDSEANR
jgi:hypothetical protein